MDHCRRGMGDTMSGPHLSRRPSGTPRGGQFAPTTHAEADTVLGDPRDPVTITISRHLTRATRYDDDGQFHDGPNGEPAVVIARADGTMAQVSHYQHGLRHDAEDGTPASIRYARNGSITEIAHYSNGERSDPPGGGPAVVGYRSTGDVQYEMHYLNGKLNDPPGGTAAVTHFGADGSILGREHFRHGEPVETTSR